MAAGAHRSVVFGDAVRVGEVTISNRRPPYRLAPLGTGPVPLAPEDARSRPVRMLLARHEVVPFVGREADLADLDGWMESPDPMAVRLVHGAGGQGKTRLARHLAARVAARGWTVWRTAAEQPGEASLDLPGSPGLLVVVDRAERWPATLLTTLRNLGLRVDLRVRVLLLSRSDGSWFEALTGDLEPGTASTQALRPLTGLGDRVTLFRLAATHFAERLETDSGVPPLPAALDTDAFRDPLSVGMAALAGVDASARGVDPPGSPDDLPARILGRERADGTAAGADSTVRRAEYVATLTGAVGRDELYAVLGRIGLTGTSATAVTEPHDLRPDRLGEDLIGLTTPGGRSRSADGWPADPWATDAVRRLLDPGGGPVRDWMAHALTVLVEAAHRWPHVTNGAVVPVVRRAPALAVAAGGAALARLVDLPDLDTETLEALEAALPDDRQVEFGSAIAALSTVLTHRRLAATDDPAGRARLLSAHAGRLGLAGRTREALRPATAAVDLYRELAGRNPATYLQPLARALVSASVILGRLDENGPALSLATEATALLRRPDGAYSLTAAQYVTTALIHEGALRAGLGDVAAGLAATDEAIGLLRHVRRLAPDTPVENLARALTNSGNQLVRLGRRSETLDRFGEAVALRRVLATARPADHAAGLAGALTELAAQLDEEGRRVEALTAIEEVVALHRWSASTGSDGHLAGLAAALTGQASALVTMGRVKDALPVVEEAVSLLRDLAAGDVGAHGAGLARALRTASLVKAQMGRLSDAIADAEEAVALLRMLGRGGAPASTGTLGAALVDLGGHYAGAGRTDDARAAISEGVAALPEPATGGIGAFEVALARALTALAEHLTSTVTPRADDGPRATAAPRTAPAPRQTVTVRLGFLGDVELGGGEVRTRDGRRGRRYSPTAAAVPVVRLECRTGTCTGRAVDRGFRRWSGLVRELTHLTGWALTPTAHGLALVDPDGEVVAEGDTPLPGEWVDAVTRQQRALVLVGPDLGVRRRSEDDDPARRWRALREAQRNGAVAAGLVPWSVVR